MTWMSVVLRHLTRRSARTFLTVLGIALSSGACFAVTGLMQSFERSMIESLDDTGTDFVVAPRGAFSLAGSSMPQEIVTKIAAVPAVETATGVLLTMMTIDASQNQAVLGRPVETFAAMRMRGIEGRLPSQEAAFDVVLGDRMAQHLAKKVGDTLEIDYVPFRVSAIVEFDIYMNRSLIIIPLQQLQRLAQRQTTLSFVEVRLKRPFVDGTPAASRAAIARAASPYDVMDAQDFVKSMHLNKIIRAVSNAVAAIMLLITVMIVTNTMLMSVGERIYEFGVLSAVGWSRRAVMSIVIAEAFLLTAGGGFLGLLIGSFAITTASEVPQQPVYGLPIHPVAAGHIFLAVLAAGLVGAIYPARKALRLNAVDALRRA